MSTYTIKEWDSLDPDPLTAAGMEDVFKDISNPDEIKALIKCITATLQENYVSHILI